MASPPIVVIARRSDNRRNHLLVTAARLFGTKGYEGTTMRDIAAAVGMLPGSLYYHFASKEELLLAVHETGMQQIMAQTIGAIATETEPWARLEAACVAHLSAMLDSELVAMVTPDFPSSVPKLREEVIAQRDAYEQIFQRLIDALDLPPHIDRHLMRLQIFGALQWTRRWYHEGGAWGEEQIARHLVAMLRAPQGGRPARRRRPSKEQPAAKTAE